MIRPFFIAAAVSSNSSVVISFFDSEGLFYSGWVVVRVAGCSHCLRPRVKRAGVWACERAGVRPHSARDFPWEYRYLEGFRYIEGGKSTAVLLYCGFCAEFPSVYAYVFFPVLTANTISPCLKMEQIAYNVVFFYAVLMIVTITTTFHSEDFF